MVVSTPASEPPRLPATPDPAPQAEPVQDEGPGVFPAPGPGDRPPVPPPPPATPPPAVASAEAAPPAPSEPLPAGDSEQAAGAKPGRRRPRSLRLRVALIGLLCLSLGLFGSGVFVGWTARDRIQAMRAGAAPDVVEVPAIDADADAKVPDLRGLTLSDAKQALADMSLDPSGVTVVETEWAGTTGLVVSQDPVVGEPLTQALTLTVSKKAKVPKVVGLSRYDAVAALRALGSEPRVEEKFDATAATGSVLEVKPGEGADLPSEVTLTVAQAGSSIYLSKLDTAHDSSRSGSCSTRDTFLAGTKYTEALQCSSRSRGEETSYAWLLEKHGSALSATVGVSDDASPSASARIRVLGDGAELANTSVSYGQTQPLNIDVTGVLRLEIVTSSDNGADVYLGDAIIKGTDSEINQLETK